jgi:hypothetical protein
LAEEAVGVHAVGLEAQRAARERLVPDPLYDHHGERVAGLQIDVRVVLSGQRDTI